MTPKSFETSSLMASSDQNHHVDRPSQLQSSLNMPSELVSSIQPSPPSPRLGSPSPPVSESSDSPPSSSVSSSSRQTSPSASKVSLKAALNLVKNIPTSLKPSHLSVPKYRRSKPSRNRPLSRKSSQQKSPSKRSSFDLSDAVGVCSIEVNRATGLPYWKAVTRLGFDMDPFVIISFGKKIFKTRVVRHSMEPVWDQSLFFHVPKREMSYSILFNMSDRDKMSSNDHIGESELSLSDLVKKFESNMKLDPETGLYEVDENGKLIGDQMNSYQLPVIPIAPSTSAKTTTNNSTTGSIQTPGNGMLFIKAKFVPCSAMRQVFWRKYLEEFDIDNSCTISMTELTSMLDSLGSTLTRDTISGFFSRYGKSLDQYRHTLSFEQVISCLESQLLKSPHERHQIDAADEQIGAGQAAVDQEGVLRVDDDPNQNHDDSPTGNTLSPVVSISFIGHNSIDVTQDEPRSVSLTDPPGSTNLDEILSDDDLPKTPKSHLRLEKVVNITCCPICHQEQPNSQVATEMVTHMSICASQDWTSLQNILSPGNFVTSSQANRKWLTKVIGKVQNGTYSLGANSANIIVQDRKNGKLLEEKMQAYVRLGIRLMYKSGSGNSKENRMEHQRIKKLLKFLTIKQGVKYDSPESVKEIGPFIKFHDLDLNEVELPLDQFKTFNEFFYRKLKQNARPIESPEDSSIFTSLADCRLMVFNNLVQSKLIWIKGRNFSLEKILGELGKRNIISSKPNPESLQQQHHQQQQKSKELRGTQSYQDEIESENSSHSINFNDEEALKWSLGIFRLAPQDYHRFHSPIDGFIIDMEYIEGQYYTVNPMAIRSSIDVYGENVRVVVCIQTEKFDKVYCVFVGAMMVGSIKMNIKVGDQVRKGDDIGYFAFGGSTILTIIQSVKIEWDEDLQANSSHSIETLVRIGTRVGIVQKNSRHIS